MTTGGIELENKLVLGPMAGYTDAAFRQICSEQGADLCYTEMISAKALYYKNKNTKPLARLPENACPTVLQLFGNDPELLAQQAQMLEDEPYVMFDVNMGCPVPKVVNNMEGSALMREPALVGKIIRKMTDTLKKPVSVKIRKGFDENSVNAVEIAKIAQDNGACMVAVHGRTRVQMYAGKADYSIIRQVKDALDIPVIGSGDIYTVQDVRRMLDETGADAVMAARGARGNPWIFRQMSDPGYEPSADEVKEMIMKQLMLTAHYHELDLLDEGRAGGRKSPEEIQRSALRLAVRQMRKHVGFYSFGFPNAAAFRRQINTCETLEQFTQTLTLLGA